MSGFGFMLAPLVCVVGFGPLLVLAYELGAQQVDARQLNVALLRGFMETWNVAWHGRKSGQTTGDHREKPADNAIDAVLRGLAWAAVPPAAFLLPLSHLRSLGGVVWIAVAGVLVGVIAYSRRRAAPYVLDPPGTPIVTTSWSLFSLVCYEPEGHIFVRTQIACAVILPVWWLAGALLLLG